MKGENGLEFLCAKAQSFHHQLLKGNKPEEYQAKTYDQTLTEMSQFN